MSLDDLKKIIEDAGWKIEEVSFGGGDTGLELFKYSPAGEDFSFVINDATDPEKIIQDIYEYEDDYDPNEHMALWVESAGKNGTPDLMTLAEDAKDIGKMIEELADAIRSKTQKSIGEIVDDNKVEESKDEKTKVYNFSIELKTDKPDSIEFKKLTHHMDYLIDFDNAEYPIVVSNVEVTNDSSTVKITGILNIVFNDKVLSTTEIEDMLSNLIILDGWDNLDFKVIDVSVSNLKEESKLQEDDENDEELDKIETQENEALNNLIKEWEDKSPLHERVISEIVEDSGDYEGTELERIKMRLDDISHGLSSGIVSSLVYYTDTTAFYNEYEDDIYDIIDDLADMGTEPLEALKQHHTETEIIMHTYSVVNTIVWMVYEEIAYFFGEEVDEI